MNDFNDTKKNVSVYNEAQLQIIRLNNIWSRCHSHAKGGNLSAYKWELDRAWIELTPDAAKATNPSYYFKAIEQFNASIAKVSNPNILYTLLQKKEIFLKLLQEDTGKGSKRRKEGGSWY